MRTLLLNNIIAVKKLMVELNRCVRIEQPGRLWDQGWRPTLKNDVVEAGLHELVEHCFLNNDALALIVTGTHGSYFGEPFHKLCVVLQEWKCGIGLQWDGPTVRTDKRIQLFIENRNGGWSQVLRFKSHDELSGLEPSFIMVEYNLEPITGKVRFLRQLGRRRGIKQEDQKLVVCPQM